jgi:hypothetical protein
MRSLLVICVAVTVLGVAGCAGDEPAATGSPAPVSTTAPTAAATPTAAPGASASTAVCDLVTVDQATDLFGVQAKAEPSRSPARECTWTASGGGMHQLHVQVYQGKNYYSAAAWGGSPEPVAGVGDEAFLVRKAGLGATVGYRYGNTAVFVNYQILLTRDPDPGAKADKLIALAKAIRAQQ